MNPDKTILLNPGPVNISERVRSALLRPDICHREPEFSALLKGVRQKILTVLGLSEKEYAAIVITGSGTSALECATLSFLSADKKILIVKNGVYGERIAQIAASHQIKTVELTYQWGSLPVLSDIEAALKSDPAIEIVALIHHETTTGLINPVQAVGALAKRYQKNFLVDSISGIAGEAIEVSQDGVDILVGTANKCIHGLPGSAFVCFHRRLIEKFAIAPRRSYYLSASAYFYEQEQGCVPFTPAVQVMYAFNEALDELLEEGVEKRIALYKKRAALLRAGFKQLGLKFYIPEELMSNTITTLYLPEGVLYQDLHDFLKKAGFTIYAGQGNLSQIIFRIANMGNIPEDELFRLLEVLETFLRKKY